MYVHHEIQSFSPKASKLKQFGKLLPPTIPQSLPLEHPQAYQSSLDLWERAREQVLNDRGLTPEMKADLRQRTLHSNASDVLLAAQFAREQYQRRSGERTCNQEAINKIIMSARKFSVVADAITAFDPTNHAGMVWGGVKVFLNVQCHNISL